MRPRIALNTSQSEGGDPKVKNSYVRAILSLGCTPVIIPPRSKVEILNSCQGLILIGGPDLPPEFYGGRCHKNIWQQEVEKVDHDFKLISYACKIGVPILGICAGMQTLGCFFGGSMLQHIPEAGSRIPHQGQTARHKVVTTDLLGKVLGPEPVVNSRHHQCLFLAGNMRIEAFSPDGFIEAVSHRRYPIVGVQWHPEDLIAESAHSLRLFRWFIKGFPCQ